MAADSAQERTEAPTPRRRQEARDEGRVPHSVEFGTAVLFLGAAAAVNVAAPAASARVLELFGGGLRHIGDSAASAGAGRRGDLPPARAASARVWAGVVPQQPPITFTHPSSTNRRILSARLSGVSS